MGFKNVFNRLFEGSHYRLVNQADYERIYAAKHSGINASESFRLSMVDDLKSLFKSRSPKVVYDVGANKAGTYQLFRTLFPEAEIHCFEPDERILPKLEKKIEGDAFAHLHRCAIGETEGTIDFYLTSSIENNSILAPIKGLETDFRTVNDVKSIPCTTLDLFSSKQGIDYIDLLKMDIQGAELKALRGANGLLDRKQIGCLYLELLFTPGYEGQAYIEDIMAYLRTKGYVLFNFYNANYEGDNGKMSYCDGLFVPEKRSDDAGKER
jgi:FkbM family methyltransferase